MFLLWKRFGMCTDLSTCTCSLAAGRVPCGGKTRLAIARHQLLTRDSPSPRENEEAQIR